MIVAVVFAVVRLAWRIWRGDEEFEPGGSLGRQFVGRYTRPSMDEEARLDIAKRGRDTRR